MKKPYEQGYYDGYQDCKCFYDKLLFEVEKDKKRYEERIKFLEYNLHYASELRREEDKLITLGKAVKTLIEENKR